MAQALCDASQAAIRYGIIRCVTLWFASLTPFCQGEEGDHVRAEVEPPTRPGVRRGYTEGTLRPRTRTALMTKMPIRL